MAGAGVPERVSGEVEPGYGALADCFRELLDTGLERGGSVAVWHEGRLVADLWGGHADLQGGKPFARDTLVNIWSVTKAVTSVAAAIAVERGLLAYDRPIAAIWPDFAAGGKEAITLDMVMSHRSGLNGLASPMDEAGLLAWHPYVEALAAQAPNHPPLSHCVYHALSFGHLVGEPLRRATGLTPGAFIAREIAGPLGLDIFVGLPEEQDHRAARMIAGSGVNDWIDALKASPFPEAVGNPDLEAKAPDRRAFRAAEIPGANGMADARSLATLFGRLADGTAGILSPAGLEAATAIRFDGMDDSFQSPSVFGAGFAIRNEEFGAAGGSRGFGHTGWGGSVAFGNPDAGLGFAYVTTDMRGFLNVDPRRERLSAALAARLG